MLGAQSLAKLRERVANGDYPNVLVDNEYRECVCFLCVEEENDSGVKEKQARATGFFVTMPINEKCVAHYLVTARHVIDESRQDGTLYAKINLVSGAVRYAELPQDAWTCHPSTDVAAIEFKFQDNDRNRFIAAELFADEMYLRFTEVDPGDEVFFIGLFSPYSPDGQAEPIVRFGHIALGLKKIPITPNSQTSPVRVDAYLTETKSWGGESGSPVFHCKWPNSPVVAISRTNPRLIGLLHGHYDIERESSSGGDRIDLNSGIGIIIPVRAIRETLMDPEFVERREKLRKVIESKIKTPTPD